ncbi:DNA circularization protein [Caulobacter soli]|uniref:DNA circularization protein n=1 Tax=Caulobacter soli TaxID=2708539 RepID=UPI0013EC22D8|nr:DNA circularization N-terminal domain-containing protein [Caulobacter soli]
MATWQDTFTEGSFRGAAFLIQDDDHQFGRRVELHEYPLRALPWPEDLGREARRWTVDCYVLGDDYMTARDALIVACETEGPGTLVHPYFGVRVVAFLGGRCRQSAREGGLAVFSLEFVEAGEHAAPAVSIDTQGAALVAVDGFEEELVTGMPDQFDIEGQPTFVVSAATDLIGQAASAARDAAGVLSGAGEALYAVRHKVDAIRAGALALARAPGELAGQFIDLVRSIKALADTPAAALAALRPLMSFGSTVSAVLGTTTARVRQRANQDSLVRLVQGAAAAQAVAAASQLQPASYQDAVSVRDDLAGRIDVMAEQAADAGDDEAFIALTDLRAAVIRDLTARGGSLARLFDYTPPATAPALVLSWRLYGDALRDQEIVDRNRVEHPGFVPGGVALEVLTPEVGNG